MSVATRPSKIALILLIAAIAAALWIPLRIQSVRAGHWIGEAQTQLDSLRDRSTTATTELEAAQRELKTANDRHDRAFAAIAKAGRPTATDPAARWAKPPTSLPDWNAESPYVWLRKGTMTQLPISPFNEQGELQPEVGFVLVADAATQRTLNQQLRQSLSDYRELEIAKAVRSDDHLPGIAGQPGEKVTVRVEPQPKDGARIKQQFEAALVGALGEQRAELLKKAGSYWIDSHFAQFGGEPKIISVIRHSTDSYNVSVKTGNNWTSVGGPAKAVLLHIPVHLQPMFSELFPPADSVKENP